MLFPCVLCEGPSQSILGQLCGVQLKAIITAHACLLELMFTGGGQKLRTGSLVLPVADNIFIDREAREIMYLVASVRPSVRLSVCPSVRHFASVLLATGS